MPRVLDACAMIAALVKTEPGAEEIRRILRDDKGQCYAHFLNVSEVYKEYLDRHDAPAAKNALLDLVVMGIQFDGTVTIEMAANIAERRKQFKMSFADACGVAFAKHLNADFVTGDGEFEGLSQVEPDLITFYNPPAAKTKLSPEDELREQVRRCEERLRTARRKLELFEQGKSNGN